MPKKLQCRQEIKNKNGIEATMLNPTDNLKNTQLLCYYTIEVARQFSGVAKERITLETAQEFGRNDIESSAKLTNIKFTYKCSTYKQYSAMSDRTKRP